MIMKGLTCSLIAVVFLVSAGFAQHSGEHKRPQIPPAPQQTYNPSPQQTYNPPQQQPYYPPPQPYYLPQPQVSYSSLCVAPGISGWMPNVQVVGTPCVVLDANNNQYVGVVQ